MQYFAVNVTLSDVMNDAAQFIMSVSQYLGIPAENMTRLMNIYLNMSQVRTTH